MDTTAEVRVLYFAAIRDLIGISEERIALGSATATVGALRRVLEARHPKMVGRLGQVRFSRNEQFATDDEVLQGGDVVGLIPPVAGG